jgi:CubicO group peptidase (beta-lactamase class C family)
VERPGNFPEIPAEDQADEWATITATSGSAERVPRTCTGQKVRHEIMTMPRAELGTLHSSRSLTRRGALLRGGAALATFGAGATSLRPGALLAQEASPPADEPAAADAPGTVTAARVALAVESLPAMVEAIQEQSGEPGMGVAIVFDDEVVFSGGFGVREVGTDAAVDAETVFLLASVSKPVAATVVSSVVGDGDITWDSRMADLAPGFALHDDWPTRNVTLADLFAHRSGLSDHAGDVLEDLGFDRDEVIYRLRFLEPAYSFRNGYLYTNFGLTVAADAVAKSVGTTWEDLSEQRLYAPLGMSHTSSRFADYMAEANRALPHVLEGDAWVVAPMQRDPDAQSPAGGASSTANDLAQWLRLQLGQGTFEGQELIPAAALAPMHRPQAFSRIPNDPARERTGFYGLGLNVSVTDTGAVQWGHSGAFALGAATAVYMLPGSGFGVLALGNSVATGGPDALCLSVLDLVTTGSVSRDWLALLSGYMQQSAEAERYGTGTDWETPPADATAALADDAYVGEYFNDFYGNVEIAQGSDGLVMRIGPEPLAFALQPYDRDTFSWQPIGENAEGPSGLSFLIGPDDTAVAFRDEYLEKHGPGLLPRLT